MVVNAVLVVGLAAWVLRPTAAAPSEVKQAGGIAAQSAPPLPSSVPIPTKAEVMAQQGQRFGLSTPTTPFGNTALNAFTKAAGKSPTMLMYFNKWTQPFNPGAVVASYDRGALPVIAWEPWAGQKSGDSQPAYALSKIINGDFDAYIKKYATAVAAQKWPVAIRFAHEMNGHWYPWSESLSGNKPGQYVQMWRHVHDIFDSVGATNVIWIWSPNILRPVPNVNLKNLYPGDAYVDWVGMVGYQVVESTASAVYQPTMTAIRKFTKKSFVLTEVGAEPSSHKAAWIKDFMKWLPQHPDVVGFVWFEFSKAQGGSADWRFTETTATTQAFKTGLAGVTDLAKPPPS